MKIFWSWQSDMPVDDRLLADRYDQLGQTPPGQIPGQRGACPLSHPVSSCLTVRQQIMRQPVQDQNLRNALLVFTPRLLALRIRGGQSPPDQHPNGVGAG